MLLLAQATSYRDCLTNVLADAQMRGEYLGGYLVRVSENGLLLHIGVADSGEERGGHRTPPVLVTMTLKSFLPQQGPRRRLCVVTPLGKIRV